MKYSPKDIKMAIGVASDKRYAGGNMTGAVKAIEKIKKGLSAHPQVAAVLKRQNEEKMKTFDELRSKLAEGKAANPAQQAAIAIAKKEKGEKPKNEGKKMDSAAMKRAMDAFKKKGGKIKKVAPGKAAGYHGKDDPGADMHGMMDRGDTKGMPRKKKVRSMR